MSDVMLRTPVREVMSEDPVTIDQDMKIDVAIELMTQHNVRRLPVVGGSARRLVGIVTIDDARRIMPDGVPFYGADEEAQSALPEVRRAMSQKPVTVGIDDSVALAAQLLVHHKIGALPVLDDGVMVGIVTESDIFRFVARGLPPQQPEFAFE